MIRLHPIPEADFTCVSCNRPLRVDGWYLPGMRTLAELTCEGCGKQYYGDLPSGFGLQYPMLLDRETGAVHDAAGVPWFARLLERSYADRGSSPVELEIEQSRRLERPVLLDCLDVLYGHALLKLLNAQYYIDREPDVDLVVLVPRFLRWLVPPGAAAIWTLDLPLSRGGEWNDWLAAELRRRLEPFESAYLSLAFPHPSPTDYGIERFSGVAPRSVDVVEKAPEAPTVTFVWRADRPWTGSGRGRRAQTQEQRIAQLAERLVASFGDADVAVTGVGPRDPGRVAPAIDLRDAEPDEQAERAWCERFGASDVVVGVHGSSMLLPSVHALAVVELLPPERLGNVGQSLLPRGRDLRDVLYRYRMLSVDANPAEVAATVETLVRDLPLARIGFLLPPNPHEAIRRDPTRIARLRRQISARARG